MCYFSVYRILIGAIISNATKSVLRTLQTAMYCVRREVLAIILPSVFLGISVHAQFINVAASQGIVLPASNGISNGVSCYDFNKDGWDDLTIGTVGFGVKTYINNAGVFQEINLFNELSGAFKQMTWIDYDNDGDADFFATRQYSYPVLMRNEGDLTFSNISNTISYPSYEAPSYGFSWGDYDNDGFPDLYICNYQQIGDITNWLFHNNGTDTFTEVATLLGVDNGVKATFQSSFFDYDLDNDVDLFVMNDRVMVNALYLNNGDGTFTDISVASGNAIAMDAMGIAWSDFDHDGDFDYFVSNTESGSMLMENQNGVFSDVAHQHGLACYNTVAWGVQWLDYNNNTFDDLYVATVSFYDGMQNYFYIHAEDSIYTFDSTGSFMNDDIRSYSAGSMDFDNDGFADIAVTNIWPASLSLWHNDGVGGHWIKFGLTGSVSNRDGIGTTVKVFFNDVTLMKQLQCGEGFMTQCSQYLLFGCDENVIADSVQIHWPSGWVDSFYNLACGLTYSFVEGETFVQNDVVILKEVCPNSSLTLFSTPERMGLWSNGETADSISVDQPGFYWQQVINQLGIATIINFQVIEFIPVLPDVIIDAPSCFDFNDAGVVVSYDELQMSAFTWATGSNNTELLNIGSGIYPYVIQYANGCSINGQVVISQPDQMELAWWSNTICPGESVVANYDVTGGTPPYNAQWFGVNPDSLIAGNYNLTITDANECVAQNNVNVIEYAPIEIHMVVPVVCFGESGVLQFEAIGGTGLFTFDFNGADPQNIGPGEYLLSVVDDASCSAFTAFTVIENPQLVVETIIQQQVSGDDAFISLYVSGGTAPYSFLWNSNSETPTIDMLAAGVYSCEIADAMGCHVAQEFTILSLAVNEIKNQIEVFPNPFNDVITINSDAPFTFQLHDSCGRIVKTACILTSCHYITTSMLPSGIYYLRIDQHVFKLVK